MRNSAVIAALVLAVLLGACSKSADSPSAQAQPKPSPSASEAVPPPPADLHLIQQPPKPKDSPGTRWYLNEASGTDLDAIALAFYRDWFTQRGWSPVVDASPSGATAALSTGDQLWRNANGDLVKVATVQAGARVDLILFECPPAPSSSCGA
jgi:hypothetical protein